MPEGRRPSLSSFSSAMISCRLVAFLMRSCSRFFSASVSFIRESLEGASEPSAEVLKLVVLIPWICTIVSFGGGQFTVEQNSTNLGSQSSWLFLSSKQFASLLPLRLLHLDEVEKSYRGAFPENPVSVVLHRAISKESLFSVAFQTHLFLRNGVI